MWSASIFLPHHSTSISSILIKEALREFGKEKKERRKIKK